MADNVTTQSATPATPPAGTVIATDDVGGVQFQRVKLVDGTLDSTTAIPGDATNGLDVDVTRVQGTVAVSGPLTDTQLRATAVPVSGTVVTTAADGVDVTQGAVADAAVITDVSGTISGKLRGLVKWAFERMPASLGQKTMANSLPVVVASDQSVLPIGGDVAAGVTDAGNPVKTGAVYSSTHPTYTDGQRGNLQMSTRGEMFVKISNAAGGVVATTQTPSDGIAGAGLATNSYMYGYNTATTFFDKLRIVTGDAMAGTGLLSITPMLWNGTTYDRLRGDATNGLDIDVTRETATAVDGAALPAVLKVGAGYEAQSAVVHPLPLQRVNSELRVAVSDLRINSSLGQMKMVLEEIRDLLMEGQG